jgi:hypothetical protein
MLPKLHPDVVVYVPGGRDYELVRSNTGKRFEGLEGDYGCVPEKRRTCRGSLEASAKVGAPGTDATPIVCSPSYTLMWLSPNPLAAMCALRR